ncbi:MAG: glycosyltransferase family 4 protein [Drouetiella hepatica Uher 2000/2452]|jgi:glycosyltransferase involved in cell wall biosynthesis|uniref:Glycosyltransferase family 4 protein n=1 Tax=Drouetiella hepatica Uher 2000/2452 TaxID=904376 RepID=A0A951QA45_9CYAN|nr:glycosyltransferase family 4 protein [Drouetiella hepatica Uher 2000/2452]
MHVIVLENEPSSRRGGQELSLIDICKGLHQRGHKVSLLYTKPGDLLEQYQSFCTHIDFVDGYKLTLQNPAQFFTGLREVGQSIKAEPESLVYSNQYQESFFGYGLASLKRIPLVCHLRLPPPSTLGIQSRLGLHGAKRLIAISRCTRTDWIAAGFANDKIKLVYNGIDLGKFQPQASKLADSKVIAYVGRLDKVKGLETLLKAIALLKSEANSEKLHLRLLIAGKPLIQNAHYQDFLHQLTHQLNITANVEFLGHVADPAEVYRSSHLVVLPSLWAEPFGRSLLEAMACGVPVVASRVGGIPEVLSGEFAQGLFCPGDAEDLAAKLRYVLDWQAQDPSLGQRCRDYVSDRFPLSQAVEGVERVMLEALSQ